MLSLAGLTLLGGEILVKRQFYCFDKFRRDDIRLKEYPNEHLKII
jgi:hypothetical protein